VIASSRKAAIAEISFEYAFQFADGAPAIFSRKIIVLPCLIVHRTKAKVRISDARTQSVERPLSALIAADRNVHPILCHASSKRFSGFSEFQSLRNWDHGHPIAIGAPLLDRRSIPRQLH
jgi:hypothetical protein